MAKPVETLAAWLEWAEARAYHLDGCLVWKQSFNRKSPQASIGDGDEKESINVRRKLWELKHGKSARPSYVIVCKCDTFGCIEPDHLKEISRSQMLSGRSLSPQHKLALTKAARNRSTTKLTQEAVDDIRYGEGDLEEKAARYGITVKYVEDVIKQVCWRDLSSPFAALMGR